MSLFAIIFALFGMSFLIFIHELGHFLMARRAKMTVEVFSIGMGKPIVSWKKNGVKWQICYIPFGGYVKIAGMEPEEGKDQQKIRGGFYSKSLLNRFLVVAAGPFVNIVFAFFAFSIIYFLGGREQPFSQHTKVIGEVDKSSAIYSEGIKEGDSILAIDDKPYHSFKDVLIQGLSKSASSKDVVFQKEDGQKVTSKVSFYTPRPSLQNSRYPKSWKTMGVLAPATYITINGFEKGQEKFSPLHKSGVEKGDRVIYVDGELIYSYSQLSDIVNKDIALVSILRDGKKMHVQVPRVVLSDLKLTDEQKDEFIDAKREVNIETTLASTNFLPCIVSQNLIVDETVDLIEETSSQNRLLENDKIIAVNGNSVSSLEDFYKEIESRKCVIMVKKDDSSIQSYQSCDATFFQGLDRSIISKMEDSLGDNKVSIQGYKFTNAVEPVALKSYLENSNPALLTKLQESMNPETYEKTISKNLLFAGVDVTDKMVMYNPTPMYLTKSIVQETFFNLSALITGDISPKFLSGPVGMVKMMHDSTKTSFLAGFYWLGMISLSLAIFNLLPIPMLDGGHICFIGYEAITKKRISGKAMQRMIFPFFIFFIAIFVYVTFNDILKFFG